MKSFLYSFYGKLSAVLLLLLLVMGIAQLYITYQSSMQFVRAADQKLNMDLAKNMAVELEPALEDTMSVEDIKSSIHYMMVFNPRIEIYVLDERGGILAYFSDPPQEVQKDSVDLGPIHTFLDSDTNDLILGEDPRNPDQNKPFSAARLDIGPSGSGYVYIILGSERFDSALSMMQNSYIVQTSIKLLGIILGLTAVAGLILFGLLTRRLRSMTDTVEDFEDGKMEIRLEDTSKDEIGQLARSFNRMADTIQSNVEELQKTDKLRRNLIANVSHDLRSPLASMQGYLETILIKDTNLSKEERNRYLETIRKNTEMLRTMVDELFELSKLDARQVEPELESFSIAELAQDVLLKLKPRADEKGVALDINLRQSLPQVVADIGLIERVLTNLIENAIHYTEESGRVSLRLKENSSTVRIAIEDDGCGISEEDLPHIFDRFYRGDKSRSLSTGSTGLGLAIAKKILELHGREISVESEAGEGTTFVFSLPKAVC